MSPQRVGTRIFFISNLSGRLSLYAMNYGGSVPDPLLPPDIALQNPTLVGGKPFYVFPKLEQIVITLDQNRDENYQPMVVPIEGGFPEEAFPGALGGYRSHLELCDSERNILYLGAESREEAIKDRADELAVMVDTFRPLDVAVGAHELEKTEYQVSWLDDFEEPKEGTTMG